MFHPLANRMTIAVAVTACLAGVAAGASAMELERCAQPMATLAVVEPQDQYMRTLRSFELQSPTSLIRMMVQESNCFVVVERGMGLGSMMQERQLAQAGELRADSNVGGGQIVTADFILSPEVVVSQKDASGVSGALGGLVGGRGSRVLGGVTGGLKFSEARTTLLLADARSGVQVASAEGNARQAGFNVRALAGTSAGAAAALGGYSNTDEGQVIAAGFADNLNGIVRAVRDNPALQRDVSAALATEPGQAGSVFNAGDVIRPRIDNVRLLAAPGDEGSVVATLNRRDDMIYLGEERDGYVAVETSHGAGWVRKLLVGN